MRRKTRNVLAILAVIALLLTSALPVAAEEVTCTEDHGLNLHVRAPFGEAHVHTETCGHAVLEPPLPETEPIPDAPPIDVGSEPLPDGPPEENAPPHVPRLQSVSAAAAHPAALWGTVMPPPPVLCPKNAAAAALPAVAP